MAVKRKYRLNLRNYGNLPAIMLSQYDEGYALEFEIRDGTDAASDLSAYTVTLKGTRADTLAYSFSGTISTNVLTFVIDTTMTACAGKGTAEIAIKDTANDVLFATFNMPVFVERAAVPEGSIDADVERAQEIAEQIQEIVDTAAATASGNAEKWATGQIDGTDVPSTDPAYENNAKYYAEQAADSAASIGIDATLTQTGKAADAKKTGDEITELKSGFSEMPKIATPEDATDADLYICDANGNVLAKFEDGHIKTKNFTSESVGDLADLSTEAKTNLVEAINEAAQTGGAEGILFRNMDATDGVYASCRYHQPNASSKQFCLLMGGDIHGDTTRMNSMVEYLNAIDAFDAGIMLGDIGGSTFADDIAFYTNAIANSNKPFLTVIGNHDSGGHTSEAELCAKYITPNIEYADLAVGEYVSGNTYYYKDFSTYGIRLIVLNQYNYPDGAIDYAVGDGCYGQAEIDWLIQTLQNTPAGYGVIIAVHTWAGAMATDVNSILTASTYSNAYTPHLLVSDRSIILKIVDAWIKGSTFSETCTYTVEFGWTTLNVNADFTTRGAGEFITYIGGHWHMSILSSGYGYDEQKAYHVDCSGIGASRQGDTPRKEGTRSEDAICALAVDRDTKTVKIFRIGAHFTKDAVDRLYAKYSYGTD